MPHVDHALIGEPPKDNHMYLVTDETGQAIAIPVGAYMGIVEDPKRYDGTMPLILMRVNFRELVFRCGCGNPKCSRMGKFKAVWKGVHPQQAKAKGQEIVG